MYSRTLNQLLDSLLYDVHLNFSLGNSETAHVTVNYMMRLSNNYSSPKMFDHIGTAVSIQLAYGLLVYVSPSFCAFILIFDLRDTHNLFVVKAIGMP